MTEEEYKKRKKKIWAEAIRQRNELSPPNTYRSPETKMMVDGIISDAYQEIRKLRTRYYKSKRHTTGKGR